MTHLSDYLNAVWRDTDGYGCIALKNSDGSFKRVYPKWPEQKSATVDFILGQSAQGKEVYITPSLWKAKVPNGVPNMKEYFLLSHVLWADLDGNAPESWDMLAATILDPSAVPPEPSLRMQTSSARNQHLYWFLNQPITDVNLLENKNKTIAYAINADPGGYDAPQLLRPPDTVNYGIGKEERKGKTYPVFIEETTGKRYSSSIFKITEDFRKTIGKSLGKIPDDIREILATKTWSKEFWEAFSTDPPHKGRSDRLQEVAYFAAEAGFTNEEIYAVIRDCDDRWGKYKNRTDRHIRLVDIVERAKTKHPTALTDEPLSFEKNLFGTTEELKTLYTFGELMALDIKLDWLFEGLLPVGGYGIIAGPTGVGKTQLSIRMAEKFVQGSPWFQWPNTKENGKAIIFSFEMNVLEVKEFLKTMSSNGNFLTKNRENFFVVPVGDVVPLDQDEGRKFFEHEIAKVKPDLIIIDSLSKSMGGSFNDDNVVRDYNKYINSVRNRTGAAIVTVHHNRKSQDKRSSSNELDDLYGSRYLSQDLAFLLMVLKDKRRSSVVSINAAKLRFTKEVGTFAAKRSDDLDYWEIEAGDLNDSDKYSKPGFGLIFGEESGQ